MGWKRGSFYALQAAEHKRRQKVTDAVKERSRTPGFQRISGRLSSARPCGLSLADPSLPTSPAPTAVREWGSHSG